MDPTAAVLGSEREEKKLLPNNPIKNIDAWFSDAENPGWYGWCLISCLAFLDWRKAEKTWAFKVDQTEINTMNIAWTKRNLAVEIVAVVVAWI